MIATTLGARARVVLALSACAGLAGCEVSDVIARRVLASCEASDSCAQDGGLDAGPDAGPDTGADAGPDAGRDAGPDAGFDAGPPDAGPDAMLPPGDCSAQTCGTQLQCTAPVPTVAAGDGCTSEGVSYARHALCSCGDFVSEAELTVRRAVVAGANDVPMPSADVAIDGTMTMTAPVVIEGALSVQGALELEAGTSVDASSVRAGTGVAQCDCDEARLLAANDVLALEDLTPAPAFDAALLEDVQSDATVALECGVYRVRRVAGPSGLRLTISGHVVLIVEGDIALDNGLEATLASGALLEVYVLGNVRILGALIMGTQDNAGGVRMNVLGTGTIDLSAETFIAGGLYAPRAELVTRGQLTALGPVFVRRAAPGGPMLVRYDDTHAQLRCAAQ